MAGNAGSKDQPRLWEAYQPGMGTLNYSVLSADGRWRLSSMFGWPAQLFDLHLDSGGHQDVSEQYPERVRAMHAYYVTARVPMAKVLLREQSGKHRSLTGFDQMRSPDEYGQTVLFELFSGVSGQDPELIRQPNDWTIGIDSDARLKLDSRLGSAVSIEAPTGDCSIVALVLEERRAGLLGPRRGSAMVRLFLDGAMQAVLDFDGEFPRKDSWPATEIRSERVGKVRFFNQVAYGNSSQLPYHDNVRLRDKLPSPIPYERLTYPKLDALSGGLCLQGKQ